MATVTRFPFDFDPHYRLAARAFGIRPASAWLDLSEDKLVARFGPWHVQTPRHNVASAEITGPYSWIKTAGPAHVSLSDRGLTFATNGRCGVCLAFREAAPGIDPFGLIHHPNLTVTVQEPERLLDLLR